MKITPFFCTRKFGSPDYSVFLENINQEEGGKWAEACCFLPG